MEALAAAVGREAGTISTMKCSRRVTGVYMVMFRC
jgi:hypothetical protein